MLFRSRMDLVTRMELIFQPTRAGLIVAAALLWREPWACAAALVLASGLQLPLIYAVKSRCLANDWPLLRRQLGRSGAVALLALAPPALLLWLHPREAGQPLPASWFALAILACCLAWLLALVACRHPLAADPVFVRLTRRRQADNAAPPP